VSAAHGRPADEPKPTHHDGRRLPMDDLDRLREELLQAFVPDYIPLLTAMSAHGVPVASHAPVA
jgi:hypothetical protein